LNSLSEKEEEEEEEEENIFAIWQLSGSIFLRCFCTTRPVVGHEALENEW